MAVGNPTPDIAVEATQRALALADELFPTTFKPDIPDVLRMAIALLARCVTTGETCLYLAKAGRRSDLMVAVRTLFEHVVTFAWLMGTDEPEPRLLLWERFCDEQAIRFDNEVSRLGGERGIDEETRAEIANAGARLSNAKLPGLADRAVTADREWADRLGLDPMHRDAWSLRKIYSIVFRVGSAMAHPTFAGLSFVMDKRADGVTIDTERPGPVHDALMPAPVLIGTALAISAQVLGRPTIESVNAHIDWLIGALDSTPPTSA